ncbi:MAG: matrixin family metalloprotease [Deltaproteobacteria bacterium]|nr:matrixin family metalloprotease [Deltaproteobacteria bacterium]
MRSSLGFLAATAVFLASSGAGAFCRSTTCSGDCERDFDGCKMTGAPLYWPGLCVGVALNAQASEHIPFDVFQAVARRSIASWSSLECPKGEATIAFVEQGPVSCHTAEYDPAGPNANIILFQDMKWSYKSADNTLAKTTVTYDTGSGLILDADIELNHAYNELTVGDEAVVYDLESILTHELGHFIGLDHTQDFEATMNAAYDPGTKELRTLEQDDIAGACTAYPPGRAAVCDPTPRGGLSGACKDAPEESGCAVTRERAKGGLTVSAFALGATGLVARRWRLRRRRGST